MLLPSSKQTRSKRRLEDAARRGLKRIKIIKNQNEMIQMIQMIQMI
jgi:hypothetical protein